MTTELPAPGSRRPEDYAYLSHRFVDHARIELARGRRLQASEKVWGAANQALKALAAQRGWRHRGQRNVFAVANQLAAEQGRSSFWDDLMNARAIHYNFYDNDLEEEDIEAGIAKVEQYVADLEAARAGPPQPFTISNERDQGRIRRLTGRTYAIGTHSANGFVQERPPPDDAPDSDDNGGSSPAVPPGPAGPPPEGGQEFQAPVERGRPVDLQLKPGKSLPQEEPADAEMDVGRRRRGKGRGERRSNPTPHINIRM